MSDRISGSGGYRAVTGGQHTDVAPDPPAGPTDDATRRQVRGSSLLFAGRLLSLGANLVVQVLIVRTLGRGEFGAFALALSIVTLAQLGATLGIDRALPRFLALYDERGEHARLAGAVVLSVGSVLALGLVTVLVAALAGRQLLGDGRDAPEAAAILAILIFLAPIRAMEEVQLAILATFARPRALFLRRHVLAPALSLTVVGLLVVRDADAAFLAAGYVVAGALGLAVSVSLAWSALAARGVPTQLRRREVDVPWAAMASFAFPLITTDALYLLVNSSDAIFLASWHGTDAVAAVRAVVPIATLTMLVMTSFTPLYTPLAARLHARSDGMAMPDLYWQTAIWIAVTTFPVFLVTVALAAPLTTLLFGQEYASSAPYLVILSAAYYVNAALGFNGLTVRILGRLRPLVVVNVVAAVLNIGLNLLLVPSYGALGAVITTAVTLVAHNVMKQLALRGTSVEPMRRDALPVYLLIVGLTIGVAVVAQVLPDDLPASVLMAGLTLVAVATLWLFARPHLRVAAIFPEVLRLPFARQLFSA